MRLTTRPDDQIYLYPYIFWDNAFSDEELKNIIRYCEEVGEFSDGALSSKDNEEIRTDKSVRDSKVKMFQPNPVNGWIFDRLISVIDQINTDFYRFDLTGFGGFQYSEYRGNGAKYDFHTDIGFGTNVTSDHLALPRKLSISLLLSEPEEDFQGGEFEVTMGDTPITCDQKKGRILAFPSWVMHRVTPVTGGNRKSIVVWVRGPKFK